MQPSPFDYLSEGNAVTISKRYLCPLVHCSNVYNSQDMKRTWMFISGLKDKENAIKAYNGILFILW